MVDSQSVDSLEHGMSHKPFEIKPSLGKGIGAFAVVNIRRGSRIIAEAPMLIISNPRFTAADVERAFDRLTYADKEKYLELSSSHGQDPKDWPVSIYANVQGAERARIEEQHAARTSKTRSLLSIFQNNCMEREGGAAIFYECARFNHSCVPNAFFAWNVLIGRETVHAIRDISAGEEITISYCDPLYDQSMREWQLKHYSFKCSCAACEDAFEGGYAAESKERRFRLRELSDAIENLRSMAWVDEAKQKALLKSYEEMVSLLIEEGLRTGELGRK
jgi:hypothetical protein